MPTTYQHSPFNILQITPEETHPIRQQVLRPGRPARECVFEGDNMQTTLHLGVFVNEKPVGVASYMKNDNPLFNAPVQYQLRGMAVLPEFRNQKFGKLLLLEGEKELKKKFPSLLLWFNARETAVGFYRRYGYETTGELFMIPNVCQHIVMFRELN